MAYKKKTWTDRIVEFAGRRTLTKVSGDADSEMVVDVSRNEGVISQTGDAFSAANMNDLEQRIADAFGVELKDTLSAGGTSLLFTDKSIKSSSVIDVYTDIYGVNPTDVSQSGTTLTLTFDEQKTDVDVMVIIREGI